MPIVYNDTPVEQQRDPAYYPNLQVIRQWIARTFSLAVIGRDKYQINRKSKVVEYYESNYVLERENAMRVLVSYLDYAGSTVKLTCEFMNEAFASGRVEWYRLEIHEGVMQLIDYSIAPTQPPSGLTLEQALDFIHTRMTELKRTVQK